MGTGGVGGYYGGRLAAGGNDVWFLARGANLQALRRNGLELRSDLGDDKLDHVNAGEEGADAGPVDAAIVCVKTYDNESASKAMEGAIADGTVVCSLQNGVDNEAFYGERFPQATVIGATSRIVAWLQEPGVVIQRGPDAAATVAPFDPGDQPAAEALAQALRGTGVETSLSPDAQAILWLKLVGISSVGTITAYGRCTVGEAFADPTLCTLMEEACRETDAVGRARGIALPPDTPEAILGYARSMNQEFNSSMARDALTGRPLEIDSITGAVIRYGREVGVPTPANQTIFDRLLPLHRQGLASRARA